VKGKFLAVLLLVLVTLGAYANSLKGDFISDDRALMLEFSRKAPPLFKGSFEVTHFINALCWRLFGLKPFGYHLVSVVLHTVNTVLMFFVVVSLFSKEKLAFITALLFAVHPVNTQVVSWISGKPYAEMTLFFLLGLLLQKRLVFSGISFLLSLSVQVGALGFPFVSYACAKDRRKFLFFLVILLLCVPFVYKTLLHRIAVFGLSGQTEIWPTVGRIASVSRVVAYYLALALFPLKLGWYHAIGFDYDKSLEQYNLMAFVSMAVIVMLIMCAFRYRHSARAFFLGILWVFITLVPCVNIINTNSLVAERYLYLPLAGFCLALGALLDKAPLKVTIAIVSFIFFFFFFRTMVRNQDYKNEFTLYYANTVAFPGTYMSHNSLGGAYANLGKHDLAAEEFKRTIALNPSYAGAYYNLANTYVALGRLDEAYEHYQKALSIAPEFDLAKKNFEALERFRKQQGNHEAFRF